VIKRAGALLLSALVFSIPLVSQQTPFQVCAESSRWIRPSPDIQAKVWNDLRYKDFARDAYAWTHDFILIDDPQSTSVAELYTKLSGLWTAKSELVNNCIADNERRSGFEWINIWVLLHQVRDVRREANTYTVTVEPTGRGFQSLFIRRLNP